jgi:hypothetical protein
VSATSRKRIVREDYYPTPASVTRALLPLLPAGDVFDPCAGRGEILLEVGGTNCVPGGFEISAERARAAKENDHDIEIRDALDPEPWPLATSYVMNPPFSLATEFVKRAVEEARDHNITVAALLRVGFFEAKRRREWLRANPCDVYVISPRPRFVRGRSDSAAYCWALFGPGRGGRFGILEHSQVKEKGT